MLKIPDTYAGLTLISDVHFDNPHCRRDILTTILEESISKNFAICSFGDWFCAMQGSGDKRAHKEGVREENRKDDYLGSLVDCSAEFLKPYASRVAIFAPGNHETSVLKRSEYDLTGRLCKALGIQKGGYAGFIEFRGKTIYYHHGHGGGGEATRGTIQATRRSVYIPDADILVSGHIHEAWILVSQQVKVADSGISLRPQYHVSIPTMKDEFSLEGGYHLEKGRPPKPLGCAFLINGLPQLNILS